MKLLLGWHPSPTCENYIPKYRADAVIGIDKNSENILYAVWEPEVYITLENHTSQALTTNIGFPGYSGVINKVTDEFGREPFERTEVTIAVGGTLRLALPSADGAAFKVSGVYTGNKEKLYILKTDLTKFVSPGIYRYKITDETTTSALFAAGITRPDTYQTERYLDVYIKNKTSGGLEVAAYTLMKGNNITVTASDKDSGFNYDSESDEHTDIYRTFNIRIEKQVKGDIGDKTHPFPFTITINNKGKKYFCGTDINNTSESNVESMTQNLTHGQVFYIRGLCPQASVGYSETNDTIDTYKVKIEGKSDPSQGAWEVLVAESDVEANGIKTLTPGKVTNYETVNSETDVTNNAELTKYRDVQYTNTLNSVSPTGVIIRIVPFVILIAGAVVLLIVIRRIRAGKKDTRSI